MNLIWLEDEEGLIQPLANELREWLTKTQDCALIGPFASIPDLSNYLVDNKGLIRADNTCLLFDVMLPGKILDVPKKITGKDTYTVVSRTGYDAGILYYHHVIMPVFTPPLPVIFLTAISGSLDLDPIDKCWETLSAEKKLEDADKKISVIVKKPNIDNFSEIKEQLEDWGFCLDGAES